LHNNVAVGSYVVKTAAECFDINNWALNLC